MSFSRATLAVIFMLLLVGCAEELTPEQKKMLEAKQELANIWIGTTFGYLFGILGSYLKSRNFRYWKASSYGAAFFLLIGVNSALNYMHVEYHDTERKYLLSLCVFGLIIVANTFMNFRKLFTNWFNVCRGLWTERKRERQAQLARKTSTKVLEAQKSQSTAQYHEQRLRHCMDQLLIYADQLDGDSDDMAILDQMLRETTDIAGIPEAERLIRESRTMSAELKDVARILDGFGYSRKAIGRRLALLLK